MSIVTRDTFLITENNVTGDPIEWLRERGYKGAPIVFGPPALVFAKKESVYDQASTTRLAVVGETLVWDGTTVTILVE